ncbi:sugar efflux transporter [Actinospica durhamensis]|uniref:Sugar efflux transporter n=1 Tax=Actinospica durhamensis TaxID=1508375 RepID=A0A941IN15_9ACTN|nr:sugar efflux transporter [Actinospica durhamensis]MBR7833474.1 sugar efflux transporter [Actinospica durhamensis]
MATDSVGLRSEPVSPATRLAARPAARPETRAERDPAAAGTRFSILDLVRDGSLAALAGASVLISLAAAMISTSASLFLANAVRASPLMIGLFFAGRSVLELFTDLAVGTVSDRLRDRRTLLTACSVLSAVGAFCYLALRDYAALFAVGVVFFGLGGASFAQTLAYTREVAESRDVDAVRLNSTLRSLTSMTWIIGPPLGFWLIAAHGFTGMFLTAGVLYLTCAAIYAFRLPRLRARPAARVRKNPFAALPRRMAFLLIVNVLLLAVNTVFQIDIALYITQRMHDTATFAGWLLAVGAALEVPVLVGVGSLARRFGAERLMLAAACCACGFFALLPFATTRPALIALQVPNAFWTAVAFSLPVTMLQDGIGDNRGAVSALYTSSFKAGIMLGGTTVGVLTGSAGFTGVFRACSAFCAVAAVLLVIGMERGPRSPREKADPPGQATVRPLSPRRGPRR